MTQMPLHNFLKVINVNFDNYLESLENNQEFIQNLTSEIMNNSS